MALQIKRGTEAQRSLYTPMVGELVFVTDYLSAGVDPIYVGDGVTLGGVAVGQNAVLAGNAEGDINLNSNDIIGTGNLQFTGNINNVGNITTKKITLTGDGGVAVVSTGSITNTGNVNISGNIISSGSIQAVTVESDLVGSVLSSDSSQVLVNAVTNTISAAVLTVSDGSQTIEVSGNNIIVSGSDTILNLGTELAPLSVTQFTRQPQLHFGKVELDAESPLGVTLPGVQDTTVYRGTLVNPDNILVGNLLGGTIYRSYNNKPSLSSPAVLGLAAFHGFIAEDQTGAPAGIVPTTFIVGSGASISQAFAQITDNISESNFLRYSSKGELKITALNLRALGNAERTALTPFVNDGTIIYNYEPTDATATPLGLPGLQVRINSAWYNIPVSGTANV